MVRTVQAMQNQDVRQQIVDLGLGHGGGRGRKGEVQTPAAAGLTWGTAGSVRGYPKSNPIEVVSESCSNMRRSEPVVRPLGETARVRWVD